jgi:hypothetical protein
MLHLTLTHRSIVQAPVLGNEVCLALTGLPRWTDELPALPSRITGDTAVPARTLRAIEVLLAIDEAEIVPHSAIKLVVASGCVHCLLGSEGVLELGDGVHDTALVVLGRAHFADLKRDAALFARAERFFVGTSRRDLLGAITVAMVSCGPKIHVIGTVVADHGDVGLCRWWRGAGRR